MPDTNPVKRPSLPVSCRTLAIIPLIACLLAPTAASARQDPPPAVIQEQQMAADEQVVFEDNMGRDTPRSSFTGFLAATEKFDYETAAEYMDLRNLPYATRQFSGEELAEQLDFVIKRGMKIDIEMLSPKKTGQVVDGLPDYRDELGRVQTDEDLVLYLQRVPGLNENFIWKISNASIAQVPELYEWYKYPGWIESIRSHLPGDSSFLGVELFKWVIVLGAALLAYPLFWLIGFGLARVISTPASPLYPEIRKLLSRPVAILAIGLLTASLLEELGLGPTAKRIFEAKTLMTIVAAWMAFSLINLWRARRRQKFLAKGRADAHILGRPMANALKLLTILIAFLVWLSNAGIEIGGLLAGLGVGGLALALALQKPIEDLLGAVSIYSQQPVVTGDLCKYGSMMGRVEEIGLRTTRLRTLDNTLISVPNSIIAHAAIENYSARKTMLYHPALPLRYDTSLEQMKVIMDGIATMARAHDKVIDEEVRISFTGFTDSAMIVKARIYIDEDDFSNYLAVVGELNLGIMKVIQDAGAKFAQGARTVMLEQGNAASGQHTVLPGHPPGSPA